ELASFETDEHGSGQPSFELPDWAVGDYELHVSARTGEGVEQITAPIRLRRSTRLMLSSVKPVYHPGQTIQVRALGLRLPQQRPLASEKVTFTVRDPEENIIFKQSATASRFGIAAAECPLASELIEGIYTVTCTMGETKSRLMVLVQKYVL